jgi:hydroxylaminobenzene mutase
MLLFGLGLVTGLVSQQFTNPRMGLSAHLEGLMNGTFLLALGGVWHRARLSPRAANIAFGSLLYGTYANWLVTTAAAFFGTAAMTPLASGSHRAAPWQELLVGAGFGTVAISMLVAANLLLIGFGRAIAGASGNDSGAAVAR